MTDSSRSNKPSSSLSARLGSVPSDASSVSVKPSPSVSSGTAGGGVVSVDGELGVSPNGSETLAGVIELLDCDHKYQPPPASINTPTPRPTHFSQRRAEPAGGGVQSKLAAGG